MARTRRPYLPGAFFHLTARTQDKVKWFEAPHIKDLILGYIADAVQACDVDPIAYAIMDNHLHLMVRQRTAPLSALMQPILRRTALLVKRSVAVDGHVFSRKFRHRVCRNAEELRYCIGYVHRNPNEAGLCIDHADYQWGSHYDYVRTGPTRFDLMRRPGLWIPLELFARSADRSPDDMRRDYELYVKEMDDAAANEHTRKAVPIHGDACWSDLCTVETQSGENAPPYPARLDLRDVVLIGIRRLCPELDIAMVRLYRGTAISRIKAQLVEQAGSAGYRGCDIARYLHMSEARVSKILKQQRLRRKKREMADT